MPGMDNSMPGMDMDHDMPGMKMGQGADEKDQQTEHGAMDAMSHMHHHQMGPHMYMTKLRTRRRRRIGPRPTKSSSELRESIEKYKDYHVALADGFRIFMPNLPQSEYHFTNYYNGFLESFTLRSHAAHFPALQENQNRLRPDRRDVHHAQARLRRAIERARPAQRRAVAPAHQAVHASQGRARPRRLTKFGLQGSIITKEACTEAGGTFYPVIFGWMVHVYPFEDSREKIWGNQ